MFSSSVSKGAKKDGEEVPFCPRVARGIFAIPAHRWLFCVGTCPTGSTKESVRGRFALFTGIGNQGSKTVVQKWSKEFGIPTAAYSIGIRPEYEDLDFDWAKIGGVQDSNCVLVRPDFFVTSS